MKHLWFQSLWAFPFPWWVVPGLRVLWWGALCPLVSYTFPLFFAVLSLVGSEKFLVVFFLGSNHCANFRHIYLECDENTGLRLLPCGVSMPDWLAFPSSPLGSWFRLVVIFVCGRVERLSLLAHSFEYCCDASSIFWCWDASGRLFMDTTPNL